MPRYRSYFIAVLSFLAVFVVSVVLMNWLVDPLDVYRVVRKEGFNSIKSSYIPYARLAKPSQIERGHYQRLAIGSSRMLMGIPVANAAWISAGGEPGFNASIQGADLRQIRDLFEHAVVTGDLKSTGNVKSVLIDVDLFMFNAWVSSGDYPYPVATFSETESRRFVRERDTTLNLLFSPGITLASIETLRKQDLKKDKVMIDGTTNPAKELSQVLEDGYEVRFRQFEDRMVRTGWSPCSDNRYDFSRGNADKMQIFRDILQIAKQHNVDVKFFISPVHVRLLEMIHAADLWDDYEVMKRKLVAEIAAVYGQDINSVALWDFSGYHHYAQEAVPQQPDVPMQWYLDSSHFSQPLGHKMLDRMFAAPSAEQSFGVSLRPDNIDAVLQMEREQQAVWQADNAALSRDLHKRTAAILQDKKINGTVCK
ncbi:MAG TPA: hypothetical protein PK031_09360 [Pseudomonadales bacterium]|nr:hypothetical protein [Pseudomonadales bacterium]